MTQIGQKYTILGENVFLEFNSPTTMRCCPDVSFVRWADIPRTADSNSSLKLQNTTFWNWLQHKESLSIATLVRCSLFGCTAWVDTHNSCQLLLPRWGFPVWTDHCLHLWSKELNRLFCASSSRATTLPRLYPEKKWSGCVTAKRSHVTRYRWSHNDHYVKGS